MGILSGVTIHEEIRAGNISVTPFDKANLQPASIDLRLGKEGLKYNWLQPPPATMEDGHQSWPRNYLDAARENTFDKFELPKSGFILVPGALYLLHTEEVIHTDKYVTILDGKSSIGRLGIQVHLTAGFGDCGYNGQYTLEVICVMPVKIYPGMLFCQARFHTVDGDVVSYQKKGNYVGAASMGPVASKSHKQFGKI